MAVNAPIQGTAADIIKKAMLAVDVALRKENLAPTPFLSSSEKTAQSATKEKVWGLAAQTHLVLQVHDELIYEIEDEALARALPLIQKEMEGLVQEKIPFSVSVAHGKNWGTI